MILRSEGLWEEMERKGYELSSLTVMAHLYSAVLWAGPTGAGKSVVKRAGTQREALRGAIDALDRGEGERLGAGKAGWVASPRASPSRQVIGEASEDVVF